MLPAMLVVSEEAATAIRTAHEQEGELSAAIEVRRLFPGVTDNADALSCARETAARGGLSDAFVEAGGSAREVLLGLAKAVLKRQRRHEGSAASDGKGGKVARPRGSGLGPSEPRFRLPGW